MTLFILQIKVGAAVKCAVIKKGFIKLLLILVWIYLNFEDRVLQTRLYPVENTKSGSFKHSMAYYLHASSPFFCEPIFKMEQEKRRTSVFIMISHASWHMLLYFAVNKQAFLL